jgi:NAD(P)-dependent dehydrogenase (short-subunit alcohol dehydrogenase family)
MELKGKTAVITGGASGIGLATAIQFSKAGANIVLGDIEDAPLHTQVEEMRSHGATVIGVHCDVAQESDVEALRDAALKEFGAVHVIFNNAGVAGGSTIGTPKKIWDWVMSVNLDGVVNGMNAFIPLFLEQNEGHVVNTASEAGLVGVAGMGPYNASKFAVVGISESLFHELANTGKNVHVSVLCPNFVRTRIFESERNMPKELASYAENPGSADQEDRGRVGERRHRGRRRRQGRRRRGGQREVLDPHARTFGASHHRATSRVDARRPFANGGARQRQQLAVDAARQLVDRPVEQGDRAVTRDPIGHTRHVGDAALQCHGRAVDGLVAVGDVRDESRVH